MLLSEIEKNHIISVLADNNGNKRKSAKALGIGHATLYRKMRVYGIPGIKAHSIIQVG